MSTTTTTTTTPAPFIPSIETATRYAMRCLKEGRAVAAIYADRLEKAGVDLASLLDAPTPKATPATKKGDRVMTASDFIPKSVSRRRSSSDGRHVGTGLSRFRDREQEAKRKAAADWALALLSDVGQ